jgi:Cu/Ag efflux protein CusF
MSILTAAFAIFAGSAFADVQWSRLNGEVTKIDGQGSKVTIENKNGDSLIVKIDSDVLILKGKDAVPLREVKTGDRITLFYHPKVSVPKDPDDTPEQGGVYKPSR